MKTVSLELAKQLQQAGFSQRGAHFRWVKRDDWFIAEARNYTEGYAAPTVDELFEALDSFITLSRGSHGYIASIPGMAIAQAAETIDLNAANCLAKLYLFKEE